MSTLWGCGQTMGDPNVATSDVISAYDFQRYNVAAVFFELLIGNSDVAKITFFILMVIIFMNMDLQGLEHEVKLERKLNHRSLECLFIQSLES